MKGKDIIQINATVIAGILILLTIQATFQAVVETEIMTESNERTTSFPVLFTIFMIIPFSFSAICAIFLDRHEMEEDTKSKSYGRIYGLSRWALIAGFGYIPAFLAIWFLAQK